MEKTLNVWALYRGSTVCNWLLCRTEIGPLAKLAYGMIDDYNDHLYDYRNEPEKPAPLSFRMLTRSLGCTERQARAAIKELVNSSLISVSQKRGADDMVVTFYRHPWQEVPVDDAAIEAILAAQDNARA